MGKGTHSQARLLFHLHTCEPPICNVEHELEFPILVVFLPLLIFLSVTILLCLHRLLLLSLGVIWWRGDGPSSLSVQKALLPKALFLPSTESPKNALHLA